MLRSLSLALILGAIVTGRAGAASLSATPRGGFYDAVTIIYGGHSERVIAGPFSTTLNGSLPFDAYCVDLDDWNSWHSTYSVTPSSTDLLTHGAGIAWLYDTYAKGVSNATQGAALQVASGMYSPTTGTGSRPEISS